MKNYGTVDLGGTAIGEMDVANYARIKIISIENNTTVVLFIEINNEQPRLEKIDVGKYYVMPSLKIQLGK